jgi:hypothetical protein
MLLGLADPDDPVFVDTKREGVGLDVERHDRCLLVSFFPELIPGTHQFLAKSSAEGASMPPASLPKIISTDISGA